MFKLSRVFLTGAVAAGMSLVAACAPQSEPVRPQVSRPVEPVRVIPPRPYPPMGAAPNLMIPPRGLDGSRPTVNSGLSGEQALWNLRSAYNVAALNCQRSEHAAILANYSDFLKTHARTLSSVNRSLENQFKSMHGGSYIRVREAFQTKVYNYFALPPVMPAFCDATLSLSQELRGMSSRDLQALAPISLARLEAVYQDFFNRYDQYRVDLSEWEARYGRGGNYQARASFGPAISQ